MQCYNHPELAAVAACAGCGKGVCETCAVEVGGRVYCKQCLAAGTVGVAPSGAVQRVTGAQQYSGGVRWLLYIVSFLIPIGGLIAGIVLMTRADPESKEVGTNCLIAAVTGFVLNCVCVLCQIVFYVVLMAAAEASIPLLLPVV